MARAQGIHALGGWRPAVALAGCAALLATPGAGATTARSAVSVAQARALGERAYLYGFPLLEFLRVRRTDTSVRCPDRVGDAPVNSFSESTRLADPSARTVVAPNVDTLYSIAQLDLGKGPVVLSHPDMGSRYFVFQLLDPYTNTIGYIGTRTTGSSSGRFAITWTRHPGAPVPGARVIRSRYRRVWVIGRTLVRGRADRGRAVALMRRYRLIPPGGSRRFAPGCKPGPPRRASTPRGLAFLDQLGRAMQQNPPPRRDRPLLRELAAVGVGVGLTPQRVHLSAQARVALITGVNTIAAALPSIARSQVVALAKRHHGWATPAPDIGDYRTDYTFRAGVAAIGLGANTPAEAMYPTAYTDSSGQQLVGLKSYRLIFRRGRLPPVRAFWSLTLYDAKGFLVPNLAHRYAVGDTHQPLVRRPDGSVVVVVQRARPRRKDVNWLPAPAGAFRLTLRLYLPKRSALSGRWQPPPVRRG